MLVPGHCRQSFVGLSSSSCSADEWINGVEKPVISSLSLIFRGYENVEYCFIQSFPNRGKRENGEDVGTTAARHIFYDLSALTSPLLAFAPLRRKTSAGRFSRFCLRRSFAFVLFFVSLFFELWSNSRDALRQPTLQLLPVRLCHSVCFEHSILTRRRTCSRHWWCPSLAAALRLSFCVLRLLLCSGRCSSVTCHAPAGGIHTARALSSAPASPFAAPACAWTVLCNL